MRVIDDMQVQLEDVLTRMPLVISHDRLLKRIWKGEYQVVLHSDNKPDLALENKQVFEGDPSPVDLSAIKDSWRKDIEYRLEYLKGMQAAHVTRGQRAAISKVIKSVASRIGDANPPSASAVMDWARAYQKRQHNPLSLVNGLRVKRVPRRLHELVERCIKDTLKEHYFVRNGSSLHHAHDELLRSLKLLVRNGELTADQARVSMATLSRRKDDVDVYQRVASREGHARARMVCRTAFDGAGASYPLQRVEVDHTPLNWVVLCDRTGLPLGRPILTVVIDAYSGYILGIYISFYGPGVTSVTGVLRNAVMPKGDLIKGLGLKNHWLAQGLGDEWILDNGLEFHSAAFKWMAWELAIDLMYCKVRTPWLKPHVERFFAGLDFLTLARGRIRKRVANVLQMDPAKDAAITFSNLVRGLLMYVVDEHPMQINERKLARPFDLFVEGLERCPPATYPGSWDQLKLLSGMSKVMTVGPGGVELQGLPFGSGEMLQMRKACGERFKATVKWDPDDLSQIFVQHPLDGSWVTSPCRWHDYAQGLSWNQHITIRKFMRNELKLKGAEETLWEARTRLHDFWMDATTPRSRPDALLAARFSGVTSSRVLEPTGPHVAMSRKPMQPGTIVEPVAIITTADSMAPNEPMEFESFQFGGRS